MNIYKITAKNFKNCFIYSLSSLESDIQNNSSFMHYLGKSHE